MNDTSLPLPRYELKYLAGEAKTPWHGVRVEGRTCEIVTWGFREPIDAAEEVIGAAQSEGLPVVMPQYLKDALIAEWQQRGIHLYQRGIGREWCGNSYIVNGWDTAHQAGIAGLGMYALKLYYDTDESREGVNALKEKRKPEFRKYVK